MKILHVSGLNMSNLSAGPTYSVPSYVNAQNKIEDVTSDLLLTTNSKSKNKSYYYKQSFSSKLNYKNFIISYDLVVFHSTYILEFVKIARILRKNNIPYIIVPRGGFNQGAKNIKKWKKRIGDYLIFDNFFKNAFSIQYLTEKEKRNSVYKTQNDFVLPNGIEMPVKKTKISINESINIIYIGRIDIYIKGLDILVEAVNLIKSELKESKVIINLYGPDSRKSKESLIQFIQKYELESVLKIKQPVFLEEKQKILINSHIFIQTSRFEGLPMGVLEALSFGLPCILTPGTNLSEEVKNNEAGVEVDENPLSISKGILQFINSINDYHLYSNNAVELAKKYSWNEIAESSIKQYKKIISRFENATKGQ